MFQEKTDEHNKNPITLKCQDRFGKLINLSEVQEDIIEFSGLLKNFREKSDETKNLQVGGSYLAESIELNFRLCRMIIEHNQKSKSKTDKIPNYITPQNLDLRHDHLTKRKHLSYIICFNEFIGDFLDEICSAHPGILKECLKTARYFQFEPNYTIFELRLGILLYGLSLIELDQTLQKIYRSPIELSDWSKILSFSSMKIFCPMNELKELKELKEETHVKGKRLIEETEIEEQEQPSSKKRKKEKKETKETKEKKMKMNGIETNVYWSEKVNNLLKAS